MFTYPVLRKSPPNNMSGTRSIGARARTRFRLLDRQDNMYPIENKHNIFF